MAKVNVLREILDWSTERPAWQRDGLRRLVSLGEVKESDIQELARFCKSSHGLAEATEPELLTAAHLPKVRADSTPVALISLIHHSGVNALASDQTVKFGPALTVVYGANAAGKSGYTRILKRACRARGAEEILGNVVSGTAPGRPAATIIYRSDGTEHEYRWDDDNPPDRDLSRVSVFDRHCASVYITAQTDVAYRPLGLDLFDRLSDVCEAVRRVLEGERRALEIAVAHLPEVPPGTKVHDLLARLTSLTKPDDVKHLATLSEPEITQLEDLRRRLSDLHSDDPQKTARTLEIRAKRISSLVERIEAATRLLSDEGVTGAFGARDRMRDAHRAVEAVHRETFQKQPLPNTGSDSWRALWMAAERFSNEDAYPEGTFPVTDATARCVLCQQHLQDDAIDRFHRFSAFLRSEMQRERDQASAAYEQRRAALHALLLSDDTMTEVIDELHLEEPELAEQAGAFLEAARHRRVAVMNSLGDESVSASELPVLPALPEGVPAYVEHLRKRAGELRGTDRSQTIRHIEANLRELEARQILGKHLDAVLGEIERKQRLAAYQLCLEETKTNAITRKSSEVTKLAVTEQLTKSFKDELTALSFRHVEVEMVAAGGSRGALYHKLQLRRAPGVPVPKVVSEGEARCLSIASFFAELSTTDDRSAILFDDPVSSLDDAWRRYVAGRLVEEARARQVVVFTHDIVFLVSLMESAEKASVDLRHQSLQRGYTVAGLCESGPPFEGMKVRDRIGYVKNRLQAAGKLYRENEPTKYREAGQHIYGHLRQSWERAVEEVLLGGVVERYRKSVETQRARQLGDITDEDCKALDAGMGKCSTWEGGHDHAAAEGSQFPDPSEIEQDVQALEAWIKRIRDRRE